MPVPPSVGLSLPLHVAREMNLPVMTSSAGQGFTLPCDIARSFVSCAGEHSGAKTQNLNCRKKVFKRTSPREFYVTLKS